MTKAKIVSMMDENRNSLFTSMERYEHQKTEQPLIVKAKNGNFAGLVFFWAEKRKLFIKRTIERNPYAA